MPEMYVSEVESQWFQLTKFELLSGTARMVYVVPSGTS
jgi:hypothetical protein